MTRAAARAVAPDDWRDAPATFADRVLAGGGGRTRLFRFATATIAIDADASPLPGWLDDAYGDCAVAGGGAELGCRVRADDGCLVLDFTGVAGSVVTEVVMALLRPRRETATRAATTAERDGWHIVGEPPIVALSGTRAIVDLAAQPDDFAVNLIVGVAQRAQPGIAFLHAGAVAIAGRGVLICGRSGAGKSTTTNSVAARGHPLLGDETVGLDLATGTLWPFRRTVKLRPGPLPAALRARLADAPTTLRVDAQGLGCTWFRASAIYADAGGVPLDSVFFLRSFRERPAVEPFVPGLGDIAELQSLTQSLSAVAAWPAGAAARLVRYARLLARFGAARCYHLDLGTPDATAAMIEEMVGRA